MYEYDKKSFAQILSELRRTAGLSQRKAAADLNISQALLSHYENGAREPGLNFVCRVCDYYNVTADYLLGRSPSPQKQVSSSSEISPDKNGIRKMIYDSEDILLSLCEENGATENAAGYINACIYKLLRIIYNSNPENDMNAFRISSEESEFLSDCIISKECADLKKRCSKNTLKITVSELSKNFPDSHSLLSLIKLNEEKIACLNKNG